MGFLLHAVSSFGCPLFPLPGKDLYSVCELSHWAQWALFRLYPLRDEIQAGRQTASGHSTLVSMSILL